MVKTILRKDLVQPYHIAEMSVHFTLKKVPQERLVIRCSPDFAEMLRPYYGDDIETKEMFFAVFLNQANHVISIYQVSSGGMVGTVADIRLIIAAALQIPCTKIILSHNHPSGNLMPSEADKRLTNQINNGCTLMDIKLLDHIIITKDSYYSFNDDGLI